MPPVDQRVVSFTANPSASSSHRESNGLLSGLSVSDHVIQAKGLSNHLAVNLSAYFVAAQTHTARQEPDF